MTHLVSYAQNFEDILLWRALGHLVDGYYIDIGAQSPDTDSVSRLFHEKGWRGVHVEPTPQYAQELRERRPGDLVLQCAITEEAGALRFFEIGGTGLSTAEEQIAREHSEAGFDVRETTVVAITLDSLLQHVDDRTVHWLKIDVEGAEASVLRGWISSPQRPWIVVVESTRPLSTDMTNEEWEPMLLEKGYRFAYFDGLNRFYVSESQLQLLEAFRAPPNIFDNFSLSPHSMFCAKVNLAYHELEMRSTEREAELQEQVREALKQILQREERLEEVRQEAEQRLQAETETHAAEIVQREARLGEMQAQMDLLNLQIVRLAEDNAQTCHALERRVEQARADAQEELDVAYRRIDELLHEAHRWWVTAEDFRAYIHTLESSHSWRMTAPLRAVRRCSSRVLYATIKIIKAVLRPLLVGSIRRVLARPVLRAWLKPHLARLPSIKNRLMALASTEMSFEQDRPKMVMLGGNERMIAQPHLDKRASAVLEDLKDALTKKGSA